MKIIITDINTGEEEIITLKAPRKEQCLSNEEIRGRREFAIDVVILEGLKVHGHSQVYSLTKQPAKS